MSDPSDQPTVRRPPGLSSDGTPRSDGQTTARLPPAAVVAAVPPPATDRYLLGEQLARGGMGVVYRAFDTVLARDVAVKVLRDRPADDADTVARFVAEARVTGRLEHPAIPAVHDLGTLPDGRAFLAMKLITGQTLSDLIDARPEAPDRRRLVAEFEHVCQAVGFAHSRGVIHRDLKPSNVMVGAFGEVQVMDWGLAKEARGAAPGARTGDGAGADPAFPPPSSVETRAGQVLGTPAYMAPEQARGAADEIDERSDVFGLGGILCAVLTGKPPYSGPDVKTVLRLAARAELADCFARLDACGADPELIALAKRCLAPDRSARQADGRAVAGDVGAYRSGVEERLKAAEAERVAAEVRAAGEANTRREAEARADEQRRKRRWQLAAVIAAGALVIGGGAVAWRLDRQASERASEREREAARRAAEALERQLDDERRAHERRERELRHREALGAALDRGEAALRAGDAALAGAVRAEIDRRLPDGQAPELAPRIARFRSELTILEELAHIDAFRWSLRAGAYPPKREAAERWKKAFAAFGAEPGAAPAAEAGRRVSEALVRDRLLAALDLWLGAAQSRAVADVLDAADPDEFRTAVRSAVLVADRKRLNELIADPAALNQPARFAVPLGELGDIPAARRREVLKRAVGAAPGELTVLLELAETYPRDRAGATERVRWYQAAVAARPRYAIAWNNLGDALLALGDHAGARDALERARELDPTLSQAHNNLGVVLEKLGDRDRALAAYRGAVKADPKYGAAYHNLALALKDAGDPSGAADHFREAIANGFATAQAHNNLGATLARLDDLDGAAAAFRAGLVVAPNDALLAENLKIVLAEQARRDRTAPPPREVKRP
ncbi:MAG: tetratricopeptide repeat protein [Planctomycetes bacterium]|nr:tetratricopeptide repeat protein [Planctomycetota bacterium]